MEQNSLRLRRFVRHALLATTEVAAPDAVQVHAAFNLLCDRLWMRLRPLFGELAVQALFVRSLQVSRAEFPWLESVTPKSGDRCGLEGLDVATRELSAHVLADGLAAMLAHKIDLLSAFIGDDVVLPLVEQSWGSASLFDRPMSSEGDK